MRPPHTVLPEPFGQQEPGLVSGPSRIDQYDLVYRLGTGGMGNVYLARRRNQSGLHRLFAVKAMHPFLSEDPDFANMFLDEAHIASQLHHINVVGIVDLGRFGGCLYLVMDYVEGPTLSQLVSGSPSRPPALISAIVIDMLHGLHAAHSLTSEAGERLDLVHRDVSPSNILVGADGVARLTDFGIAKARMRRSNTSPGTRKGKLCYSAPEQITDPGNEDARVDVFAAGIVLWNSLTGKNLFKGANEAAVILSVVNGPIPPPSSIGLRPPDCFDQVCLRALSRDPSQRYQSADEMADELRRVTRRHDLVAGSEQVAAWVKRQFGAELERRRASIRAVMAAVDEPESARLARGTEPSHSGDEYAEVRVTWPGSARRQERARRWAMRVCVAAAGAVVATAAVRFLPREARQGTQAVEAAPAPAPEVTAPARLEPPPAPPPSPSPSPSIEPALPVTPIAAPDAPAASARAAPARPAIDRPEVAPRPPRRNPARRVPIRRTPPPRQQPAASAEDASPPPSAPAPAETMESNPYLRQSPGR